VHWGRKPFAKKLSCTHAVFCVSFRLERLLLVTLSSQITAKSQKIGVTGEIFGLAGRVAKEWGHFTWVLIENRN
jgi:hypothetical protein